MAGRTWPETERAADAAFGSAADDERRRRFARLQTLAYWLDDRFAIPGTNIRIGLDGLAGFIPGIGDTATSAVSAWIILEAWRLGMPRRELAAMGANVGIDWVVGLVPLVGDVFDVGFKANRRNINRILRYFKERPLP